MSKFKLLSTIAVFVLMLLATGSIFADEEEPAGLDTIVVNGQALDSINSANWYFLSFEMDVGNLGGGGSGSSDATDEKKKYCKLVETLNNLLQGALAGAPITGTASSGYSLGIVAQGLLLITIEAAYRDIDQYNLIGIHPATPVGSLFNWQQAGIDWDLSGYNNFGASHVFAAWVKSVKLGDGSSSLTDPDPSTEC